MLKKTISLTTLLVSLIAILVLLAGAAYGLRLFLYPDRPKGLLSSGPVTSAPTAVNLNLSSPDDNTLVYEANILVQGKASPHSTIIISTNKDNQVSETGSKGDFSSTVKLESGLNRLSIAAFDTQGNIKRENRAVYYSTEKL